MFKYVSQALTKKEEGEKGFTLIELLVVVIIIGILAAIAIPVFLNMREGAWKSSVESDVKNAVLAVETAATANNGAISTLTFPGAISTNGSITDGATTPKVLATVTVSPGNTIEIKKGTGEAYSIEGKNASYGTTKVYTYTSSSGKGDWS